MEKYAKKSLRFVVKLLVSPFVLFGWGMIFLFRYIELFYEWLFEVKQSDFTKQFNKEYHEESMLKFRRFFTQI